MFMYTQAKAVNKSIFLAVEYISNLLSNAEGMSNMSNGCEVYIACVVCITMGVKVCGTSQVKFKQVSVKTIST